MFKCGAIRPPKATKLNPSLVAIAVFDCRSADPMEFTIHPPIFPAIFGNDCRAILSMQLTIFNPCRGILKHMNAIGQGTDNVIKPSRVMHRFHVNHIPISVSQILPNRRCQASCPMRRYQNSVCHLSTNPPHRWPNSQPGHLLYGERHHRRTIHCQCDRHAFRSANCIHHAIEYEHHA